MEIAVVVGTRPEIVKIAPVIRALQDAEDAELYLVHTEQHYDESLSASFFEALELPAPDQRLGIGSGSHHEQTAAGVVAIGTVIDARAPEVVLAQGDTNAVLSSAIAASKTPAVFGHIEAGLRSFDWSMPEEINRIVADAVADLLFAPTETAVANLENEGRGERAYLTGNTVVDACLRHRPIAERKSSILTDLSLMTQKYIVATIHRPINTDRVDRLKTIIEALDAVTVPVVMPVHPRTKARLDAFGSTPDGSLRLVDPLDYLDFLKLLAEATLTVTDSGGIQEEASILEVPCVTVRPNTERPETVEAGVNRLVEPSELRQTLVTLVDGEEKRISMRGRPDLYGDGNAGDRIVKLLRETLSSK